MNKKKIILTVTFLAISTFGIAQKQISNNLGFGVSFYGNSWVKYKFSSNSNNYGSSFDDAKGKQFMRLDYNNYLNAHLFYEKKLSDGASLMLEGNYAQIKLDQVKLGINNILDVTSFIQKATIYGGSIYYGYTINNKKRLQFPLYAGFGGNYVSGEPIEKFFLSLSGKGKVKFYISNKIAIYSGLSYDTGIAGGKSGISSANDNDLSIGFNAYHLDSGIMFSF
jgi:hypothetical protein